MQHKNEPFGASPIAVAVLCGLLLLTMWNCENPSGVHKGNTLPDTRLANVPANDTVAQYIRIGVIPEVTLYWLGDDPDGFVIAYTYRWTDKDARGNFLNETPWTTILNVTSVGGSSIDTLIRVVGTPSSLFRIYHFFATLDPIDIATKNRILDSLGTGRPFAVPYRTGIIAGDSVAGANPVINQAPNKGTFIFASPTDSNMHKFEVAAIDNNDAQDPSPAVVHFWTLESPAPRVIFTSVPPHDQFVLRYATERFTGLRFTFSSIDPSTFEQQYSWSVDDTVSWSPWSESNEAIVTAIHFKPIQTGAHRIFVRSRNRWGVISATRDTSFRAFVPAIDDPNHPKRILIVNNNRNGDGTRGNPSNAQINGFYRAAMDSLRRTGQFDIWTTTSPPPPFIGTTAPIPPRDTLARYTSLVFLFDMPTAVIGVDAQRRLDPTKQGILKEYLHMGGKLIYSGTPRIDFSILGYDSWADEIFHIAPNAVVPFVQNTARDFVGTKRLLNSPYQAVRIDSLKLHVDSTGAIRHIAVNFPRGFGQTISWWDSKTDHPEFEGAPLGIRYLAPPAIPPQRQTYSVVHFAFPLYFGETSAVIQNLGQAFLDINE